MNAVENDIRVLVGKELAAANERFPQFHSAHEGYAVIQEEADELKEATDKVIGRMVSLWSRVKYGVKYGNDPERLLQMISEDAINAACEAIQVAAMCKKFLEMEGKQYDN